MTNHHKFVLTTNTEPENGEPVSLKIGITQEQFHKSQLATPLERNEEGQSILDSLENLQAAFAKTFPNSVTEVVVLPDGFSPGHLHNLNNTRRDVIEALEKVLIPLREGDAIAAHSASLWLSNVINCATWYQENHPKVQEWYAEQFKDL
jgi:hypothetical protein